MRRSARHPVAAALRTTVLVLALAGLGSCGLLRPRPPEYDPVRLDSGVVVQDQTVPEKGPSARPGDRVTIDYRMALVDGTVVDSSRDRGKPVTFTLGGGEVPPGLEQGIEGMRRMGRRRVRIPPELGYGAAGRPPKIPPNAPLVVDVELLEIEAESPP